MSLSDITLHDGIVLSGTAWFGSLAGWGFSEFFRKEKRIVELPVSSAEACIASVAQIGSESGHSPFLLGLSIGFGAAAFVLVTFACCCKACSCRSEQPRKAVGRIIRARR